MPGVHGLISNALAAASSPVAWSLARRSVVKHGAMQHVDELTVFVRTLQARSPRTVLEIGTAQGGVFWLLCRLASPDATLISLDLPPAERFSGGEKRPIDLQGMRLPGQTVRAIHGDSHDPAMPALVSEALDNKELDLLFIDGDHTYDGVRSDFLMYSPLVRAGGLIAFHDIIKTSWAGCEVDRFWAELFARKELNPRAIVGRVPSHFGGIGLLTKPE